MLIGGGAGEGGTGFVNVTGPSASLNTLNLQIGNGFGELNITAGGAVHSTQSITIGNTSTLLGTGPATEQGTGTVLVSGTGSTLTGDTTVTVGQFGSGTLTVQNGGVVNAPGGVFVSTIGTPTLSAEGTINIGAPPGGTAVAPGVLTTPEVHLQNGFGSQVLSGSPGTLNFNHTSNDYLFPPMITGTGARSEQWRG